MLARNIRVERSDDQLFNSSEKRLARMLRCSHARQAGQTAADRAEDVAGDAGRNVGTTRFASTFMNKFKRLGFIETDGGLRINSLLSAVLHD